MVPACDRAINLFADGSSVVWQLDLQCSTCEKRIIWQIFTGIANRSCKQSSWLSGIMNILCRETTMTVCNTSDNFQPNNSFVFRIDQFAFATSGLGERCGPFCGCARIPKSISWRILAGRVTAFAMACATGGGDGNRAPRRPIRTKLRCPRENT